MFSGAIYQTLNCSSNISLSKTYFRSLLIMEQKGCLFVYFYIESIMIKQRIKIFIILLIFHSLSLTVYGKIFPLNEKIRFGAFIGPAYSYSPSWTSRLFPIGAGGGALSSYRIHGIEGELFAIRAILKASYYRYRLDDYFGKRYRYLDDPLKTTTIVKQYFTINIAPETRPYDVFLSLGYGYYILGISPDDTYWPYNTKLKDEDSWGIILGGGVIYPPFRDLNIYLEGTFNYLFNDSAEPEVNNFQSINVELGVIF